MNLSVYGYGAEDGDNLSMVCPINNISIGYEKYHIRHNIDFDNMFNLTSYPEKLVNITLSQRTNDTAYSNDLNYTYWKIRVPYAVRGRCNGSVVFSASNT